MSAGRIIVSHSREAVGLHLAQWKTQPTAQLTPAEVRELIDRLQKALAAVKAADSQPAEGDEPWADLV